MSELPKSATHSCLNGLFGPLRSSEILMVITDIHLSERRNHTFYISQYSSRCAEQDTVDIRYTGSGPQ